MNFNEGTRDKIKLRSISVIKFMDNLRFSVDSRTLKQEVKMKHRGFQNYNAVWGKASIIEAGSGMISNETIVLVFKGAFHEVVSGKIILSSLDKPYPKDYDKYNRGKPYLLSILIDDLQPFTGKAEADV